MPRFQTKRYHQILAEMLAKVVARTGLSDISDTSVVKHVLAAAAVQDAEQYYQMSLLQDLFSIDSAVGDDLDERAKDIQPALIYRNEAVKATGNLVFSRTGTTGTVAIPVGTKGKTADGQVFTTTAAGSITPTSPEQVAGHGVGRDSGLIPAVADVAGSAGNVAAGTIIKFVQKPVGVDEVTNLTPFVFGTDKESDDSFRNRLKSFVSSLGRSTNESLESGVLGAYDADSGGTILFSKSVEDPVNRGYVTVYIDDGTGSAESTEAIANEILTEGLGGNPDVPNGFENGDTALGGEEVLYLDYKPVKFSAGFTLWSNQRGTLTGDEEYDAGNDYWVNPSSGQINFSPALSADEGIKATYTRYTGLIALAQKIIDGDSNDRENYPGLRAAGVLVYVRTPQVLIQNIAVSITVKEGYDATTVQGNVEDAILAYVNALGISGDVLVSELYSRIMSVAGVYNANIATPTGDTIMLDDQLARTTSGNVTVS